MAWGGIILTPEIPPKSPYQEDSFTQ